MNRFDTRETKTIPHQEQQSSRAAEQQSSRAAEQQSSRAAEQQSSRAAEQQSNNERKKEKQQTAQRKLKYERLTKGVWFTVLTSAIAPSSSLLLLLLLTVLLSYCRVRSTTTMQEPLPAITPLPPAPMVGLPVISSTEMIAQLLTQLKSTLAADLIAPTHQSPPTQPEPLSQPPQADLEEVDVVISGGGLKGFFVTGAWAVLREIDGKRIRIRRIAGTSVGACCAVYMACSIDPVVWSTTYNATATMMRQGTCSVKYSRPNQTAVVVQSGWLVGRVE
jgi:hypothetical protein